MEERDVIIKVLSCSAIVRLLYRWVYNKCCG